MREPGLGPRGVDGSGVGGRHAFAYRQIHPAELRGVEPGLQPLLGVGVLGRHNQPRSAPIQPVDRVEIGGFPLLIVMIEQEITQRIIKMPWPRVDGQARGLVQDNQILVLIDNIQRAGGGNDAAPAFRVVQADGQHLPLPGPGVGVYPDPVQQDAVGQPLDPPYHCTGQPQLPLQQGVRLDPRQLGGDGQLQPPHSFLDSHRLENRKVRQYSTITPNRA